LQAESQLLLQGSKDRVAGVGGLVWGRVRGVCRCNGLIGRLLQPEVVLAIQTGLIQDRLTNPIADGIGELVEAGVGQKNFASVSVARRSVRNEILAESWKLTAA
jgi:hypothetical protein